MELQFKDLPKNKKIYLASDFHLGAPNQKASRAREDRIINWLDTVSKDAAAIFLLGDLFDFWFEYKSVIPKGFVRFQGKLAQLTDAGIPIHIFTGNHDLWMFNYFPTELNIPVHRHPKPAIIGENRFLIGHGDGLGPGDRKFKAIKKLFTNPIAQWGFRWLHPDLGIRLAHKWSTRSRMDNDSEEFQGEDEWLLQYCKEVEQTTHYDYYVFGHRHLALTLPVNDHSTYFNLGEWIEGSHFLEIDLKQATLKTFEN